MLLDGQYGRQWARLLGQLRPAGASNVVLIPCTNRIENPGTSLKSKALRVKYKGPEVPSPHPTAVTMRRLVGTRNV